MQTTVEEIGKNRVRLTVEVPTADVEKILNRTYRRLAGEIRVPGFRPGKAPRSVIDQRLGKDFVRSEALKDLLPDSYAEAVRSTDIDVVAPPEIDVKSFEDGAALTFEAVVETRPEATVQGYDGLPGSRPKIEVADEDIERQIEVLQTRFATLETVERPIAEGDYAQIDLTTSRHGEPIDELTAKDFLIEVGAEMVVPELDAELVGKRAGDILKVNVTLPERFGERAGWPVSMSVLVKETKTRKLPPLDDELAKTVSEFDTLDELRADIRSRLEEMATEQATHRLRESVLDAFAAQAVEVDLPEGMVEVEVDGLVRQLAQMLAAQGMPIERYMQAQDLDGDALRSRFREQAERNLTMRLGLDALAAAESLEVSDEDRTSEIERIASQTGRPAEEIRQTIDDGEAWSSVDGDILRSKALDLLVERANVTETEDEEADEQASAASPEGVSG